MTQTERELLEALKATLQWIDDNCETTGFETVEAQADAAIAKAEHAERVEPEPVGLPLENSQEANDAIEAMLKEYNYPANPQNAGRAGWRAARLYTTAPAAAVSEPLTDEQINALADKLFCEYMNDDNDNFDVAFARAIEAAHNIGSK